MIPQPELVFNPEGTRAELAAVYNASAWPVSVWVCAEFAYDGASVPALAQPLVGGPWDPRRLPAATVHDWLYASHAVPRWIADLVFLRLLLATGGLSPWRCLVDWWAVARFGGAAWRSHGPAENEEARRLGSIKFF